MTPIVLGPGLAPDVVLLGGVVHVAWGADDGAYLWNTDSAYRLLLDSGFLNSFPRFSGVWLGYKTYPDFTPRAYHVGTGHSGWFATQADGNWPLFVAGADLYWQTSAGYDVWRGSCLDGTATFIGQHGAPDGIERLDGAAVVCRKDIRNEAPWVGGYPSYAGDLIVGQYGYGIGVALTGEIVRWIPGDASDDHPDPRCATDGTTYAITCWGARGVRVWIGTRADLLALPIAPDAQPVPPPVVDPNPPLVHTKGPQMEIDGKTVILRGPAGLLASPNAPNTGTWAELNQGWRGVLWTNAHDTSNPACAHRATKVSDGYTFTSLVHHGLAGADATKHSGAIDQQFYYKPDGNTDAGGYETWRVYDGNANGAIEAQIEYSNDEGRYFSCPLAVEVIG